VGRRPGPTDRRPGSPDNRTVRPEHRGRTDRLHRPERGNARTQDPNLRVVLPPISDFLEDEYRDGVPPVYDENGVEDRGQDENGVRRPPLESGEIVEGVLELMPDGYGFLRRENYLPSTRDIYVPPQYIRRFNLRNGDFVSGPGKVQRESDRFQALLYIKEVNGQPPETMLKRLNFDKLTPIYPDQKFSLETVRNELSTRIIDLIAPIGKGQRGMIVSPPKAGKTILLQKIANAISINNPEAKLIVLLIDERPEEVTDMQRSINGEVVYSTFDKSPDNHVKVAELVLDRAMRLVELGQDVVILMDSMTRLARAYNLTIQPTGRTLSGGLDPGALQGPKRFFGAARNIEFGGSLTIIATSLIETGSRMDEVIFEEFKGTGNMEVYLDRKLSEKRIFPAIDINKSGTRREELLLSPRELDAVWTIRKAFSQLDTAAVTEMIINLLLKTTNNPHFVSSVNVTLNDKAVFDAMRGTRLGGNGSPNGNPGGYNRGPMED
jgi:transcription termination factor Rho